MLLYREAYSTIRRKGWSGEGYMVRFWDREVACVEYNNISRQELLHYFLKDHLDEIVCIYDEYGYMGYTTYHMVLRSISLDAAVIRDVLTLDENIWTEAKKLFLQYKSHINKYPLLPVIDRDGNLISFAYEEDDANRELRQIRELQGNLNVVQFLDMYPECDCVVIYEFNELAYSFACYLRNQGIPVQVEGAMWEGLFASDNVQVPEYRCMKIYAEGTWKKSDSWEENLLRTVSVEFECIDKIYEENIRRGHIKDAAGGCEDMLQRLKSAEAVAVFGVDIDAQDSYDFLLQNGIKVECFVIWGDNIFERRLFDRPVYNIAEVVVKYGNHIVITDNHYKNSAWGMGRTDYFEYLGYRRNEGYILLRDYMKIGGNSLKTVLKGQKIAMAGDALLCERLLEYFEQKELICSDDVKYIMMPGEEMPDGCLLHFAEITEIDPNSLCLIIVPEYFDDRYILKYRQIKEEIISSLRVHKLLNYTDYFSFMRAFVAIEKEVENKYSDGSWGVKRIVLGSIESCSGNDLLRQLLDGHPSVMLMYDEHFYLSGRLFWYCVCLAGKGKEEIVALVEQWCTLECQTRDFDENKIAVFMERMCKLLKNDEKYTSQELFVIFHVALFDKSEVETKNMVIYWEPHHMPRELTETCTLWLGTREVPCDIINIVRNIYITKGSRIKLVFKFKWEPYYKCLNKAVEYEDIKKEEHEGSRRLLVRFEDLKCRPREELDRMCTEWEIPWSDSLMRTTMHGKGISVNNGNRRVQDFDLEPVYNQYEEYLSEFDRFRISLICAPWQRKYGYPFVDINLFSRRDLQEMFLKTFRFNDLPEFDKAFEDEKKQAEFLINLQSDIRQSLQCVWMSSVTPSET